MADKLLNESVRKGRDGEQGQHTEAKPGPGTRQPPLPSGPTRDSNNVSSSSFLSDSDAAQNAPGPNVLNDAALPLSLIRALRGKSSGDSDSNNSNDSSNGGRSSGNNSDNSTLVSLGNTSFGFNFDSEEGLINSTPPRNPDGSKANSEASNNNNHQRSGPGPEQARKNSNLGSVLGSKSTISELTSSSESVSKVDGTAKDGAGSARSVDDPKVSSAPAPAPTPTPTLMQAPSPLRAHTAAGAPAVSSYNDAAAAAVASLHSIAFACSQDDWHNDYGGRRGQPAKRKLSVLSDARGDMSDNQNSVTGSKQATATSASSVDSPATGGGRKKKKANDFKREERNAREKERSFRISRQINELRNLLSSGGVIVPKGTKSSVLTEAANYIRMLQQHQYRSEIDRHQLVQQIQMIGGGALGQQAATAIRHVAAQNGVWSLGNFGGVPPKSAMMYHQSGTDTESSQVVETDNSVLPCKIETDDYRYVFNSCTVGMAIASMGGAFIDCNSLFCQLSDYTKQEVCSMTIFNLTARQDLQHAFDIISRMLSGHAGGSGSLNSCSLRGALKNRTDLGLNVSLVKGEDGVAKCFCVTLISNPSAVTTSERPSPATAQYIQPSQIQNLKAGEMIELDNSPTYTAG